ncbi:MAG: peptide deformylase [Candidatus Omnitrophota bacterium]|jgi:peptide deformylase
MAILRIRVYPDPVLKQKAQEVTDFGPAHQRFFDDLVDTMFEADGVGLAAPQVGVSERVIAVTPVTRRGHEMVIVNPVILESSGSELGQEGCLSFPGVYTDIVRMKKIKLRFQDRRGETHESEIRDFLARIIQHEMDHLEGVLMIDRVDFGRREALLEQYGLAG